MTFRRLVQKGLDVFSYVLFCGGASVFAYQVYRWLRFGVWTKVSLRKALSFLAEFLPGESFRGPLDSWPGLRKTVDLLLFGSHYFPLSAFLVVLAIVIMVYFDDDLQIKE
ncbi:MAG TPA: hypothetical protein PK876_05495 [Elusimicrobiota bacterium]|nr:hypothetical protein [Elusimicrobiota bacterium]